MVTRTYIPAHSMASNDQTPVYKIKYLWLLQAGTPSHHLIRIYSFHSRKPCLFWVVKLTSAHLWKKHFLLFTSFWKRVASCRGPFIS